MWVRSYCSLRVFEPNPALGKPLIRCMILSGRQTVYAESVEG